MAFDTQFRRHNPAQERRARTCPTLRTRFWSSELPPNDVHMTCETALRLSD